MKLSVARHENQDRSQPVGCAVFFGKEGSAIGRRGWDLMRSARSFDSR